MSSRLVLIIALVFVVSPLQKREAIGDDLLLEQVRAEYPEAAAKLERLYNQVKGSGTLTTTTQPGKPGELIHRSQFLFAVDHALQKFERTVIAEADMQLDDEEAGPRDEVFVRNSRYYSVLKKNPENRLYRMGYLGKPDGLESNLQLLLRDHLSTPYGIMGTPLSELIAHNDLEFLEARRVERDGRELVMIVVKYDHPELPKPEEFVTCELLVDPENAWVIRHYKTVIHPMEVVSWDVSATYEGELTDGVPALRAVAIDMATGTQRRFELDEIERVASLPERQFTLSAYGLPEIDQPAGASRGRATLWLFGLALAALVLAIVLKSQASRLQKA